MRYTTTSITGTVDIQHNKSKIEQSTIIDEFESTVKRYGERIALRSQKDGVWDSITWREYYDKCSDVAGKFLYLGLQMGEGVAILGFNSPEWLVSNIVAIMAGG